MKPHKHAELIKAWADGATIQSRYKFGYGDWTAWADNEYPVWEDEWEYRIKPEPKKDPLKIIADLIHYPQCWDDFTYPTLEDAVIAVCENFNCTNEDTHQTKPLSVEEIPSLLSAQVWRELPIEIKTHLVRKIEERHGIK